MDTLIRPARPALRSDVPSWLAPRWVVLYATAAVALAILVVMQPLLILAANTPSGGDMGAHVFAPAYLRDVLLPSGRVMGWSNAWFAGFPIYYFYFPITALVIVGLDVFIPYGVAFKVVTVMGLVALPFASYALARGLGFDRWTSAVAGAAGGSFVFMESYSIYGGNIPSTLAGEFSFSWSFALGVVYLGLVTRATREGRGLELLPGLVLALTALTHLVTTLALVLASVPLLFRRRGRLPVLTAWGLGFLLAGFWAVPLLARLHLTANMAWVPLSGWDHLVPAELWPVLILGLSGMLWTLWRSSVAGYEVVPLVWLTLLPVPAYFLLPQGKFWNGRFLPFWYYGLFVFAGLGLGLAVLAVARRFRRRGLVTSVGVLLAAAVFLVSGLAGLDFAPGWARWNYSGYEGKAAWPEYRNLMETVATLPPGRVQWEANTDLNQFGTPMSPMLFPYWTEGTHPSMEGLYFESALTTPFHFLNHAEMSYKPSNPIPGLRYHTFDFDRGIRHLQLYGVRYYVAFTEEAIDKARRHPALTEVERSDPFVIFELPPNSLVDAATYVPRVHRMDGDFHQAALDWYDDIEGLDRWLVADGPSGWPGETDPLRTIDRQVRISDVAVEDHRISFSTTGVGVPHLVKVSYFPNWKAIGAEGPYRSAPSLMVVVPTNEQVVLTFAPTWAEWTGRGLTVLGLAGLVLWPAGRRLTRRRAFSAAG